METGIVDAPASGQSIDHIITQIAQLPEDWHGAGTMSEDVLRAMARHCRRGISRSVETGSGKTTLLFSHLSRKHQVFAKEGGNRSIAVVRESPLLQPNTVEFVEGPTQLTLPAYRFTEKLQAVLLDGPHGYPFPELEYYYLYPHLETNGLLIVDDIQIPTIHRLFEFLREDAMFDLIEVVGTTAFFRRTGAPLFNPLGDGWWEQGFNTNRHPVGVEIPLRARLRRVVASSLPRPLKRKLKQLLGRA
jgi:hypothetical protein